jgi:hypothetical protein
MSFTTIEIVKKHILEKHIGIQQIESEPVKLVADTAVGLRYPPVYSGSEKVKAKEQNKPDYQIVDFSGSDEVTLNRPELIKDSVVVASDSSLGKIFKENIDYIVDYDEGILIRLGSGEVPQGATVSVWYVPFHIYTRGQDYKIIYSKGEISRLSGGDIESGQWVYVDYVSEYAFIDDEIIANAINEANEQVLNFIDSVYTSSSDRSLVVAETYLAVSIVCRIKALEAVSSGLKDTVSSSWSILSDQYKRDAYILLEKFAGSLGGFKPPKKA